MSPALAGSLTHCTTREVPVFIFIYFTIFFYFSGFYNWLFGVLKLSRIWFGGGVTFVKWRPPWGFPGLLAASCLWHNMRHIAQPF